MERGVELKIQHAVTAAIKAAAKMLDRYGNTSIRFSLIQHRIP
jgi:hypothetical protein